TLDKRLEILRRCLDFSLPANAIDTPDVEHAMAKRRGEVTHNARLPTSSTVNRDIIDTLRPILNYARKVMKVKAMPLVDWKAVRPSPRQGSGSSRLPRWLRYGPPCSRTISPSSTSSPPLASVSGRPGSPWTALMWRGSASSFANGRVETGTQSPLASHGRAIW